jgi:hypothetical protein
LQYTKFGFNHIFIVDESGFSYVKNLLQSLVLNIKNRLELPQVLNEGETLPSVAP